MATYYARDGTPVETVLALPVNHRGEVDVYRGRGRNGKQRLYTRARLDELNGRESARRNAGRREPTMSEYALALAKEDFADFVENHDRLIGSIEAFHHLDEQLSTYWAAINLGCPLSRHERSDARQRVMLARHKALEHLYP